jgi:hypothetical protein
MHRISIHRFRTLLVGESDGGTRMHAYRALTRQPHLAAAPPAAGWVVWEDGAARAEHTSTQAPKLTRHARRGDWGPWAACRLPAAAH